MRGERKIFSIKSNRRKTFLNQIFDLESFKYLFSIILILLILRSVFFLLIVYVLNTGYSIGGAWSFLSSIIYYLGEDGVVRAVDSGFFVSILLLVLVQTKTFIRNAGKLYVFLFCAIALFLLTGSFLYKPEAGYVYLQILISLVSLFIFLLFSVFMALGVIFRETKESKVTVNINSSKELKMFCFTFKGFKLLLFLLLWMLAIGGVLFKSLEMADQILMMVLPVLIAPIIFLVFSFLGILVATRKTKRSSFSLIILFTQLLLFVSSYVIFAFLLVAISRRIFDFGG